MKIERKHLLGFIATFALIQGAGAQPLPAELPERPIMRAMQKASPMQRMAVREFVREHYPDLGISLYDQMKSTYPNLEHGVVDAVLNTWEQHPGDVLAIGTDLRGRFGPRLQRARASVDTDLEANYPNFKQRLDTILAEHGVASRWRRYVTQHDPGLLPDLRTELKDEAPSLRAWFPGKLRNMWARSAPGASPIYDRLHGLLQSHPEVGPRVARRLVDFSRSRAPGLAESVTRQFLDSRGELREALLAEFPGAREVVRDALRAADPDLLNDVSQFVRERAHPIRTDFRRNLETRLPKFEERVVSLVEQNYPTLKSDVLSVLSTH